MFSTRHVSALSACAGLVLTLATAPPSSAQEPDRAAIGVRLGVTYRNAAATFGKASGETKALTPGETAGLTVKAALPAAGGLVTSYSPTPEGPVGVSGGVVTGGSGTPPPPPPVPPAGGVRGGITGNAVAPLPAVRMPAAYAWTLDVRIVAISPATVKFEVRWNRTDPDGKHEGDTRTVSLRPGERHMLDFLPLEDKSIANLFVEVDASRVEDPAFANLGIMYELWLVHETADGQKITRPFRGCCSSGTSAIGGRQGETVDFAFDPILFPVDATQLFDGSHGPVGMRVRGTVTGRARKNNTIELVLRTERTVKPLRWEGDARKGGVGGGEMVLVVKPDETASVELPAPDGSFSWIAGNDKPSAPRPGVDTRPDGHVSIAQQAFFAGARTSVVVKVRAMMGGIIER